MIQLRIKTEYTFGQTFAPIGAPVASPTEAVHRARAQSIQDAAFLIGVPLCCPDTPATMEPVIFLLSYDNFTSPRPSRVDAAVATDDAIEKKRFMGNDDKSPQKPL